MLVKLVCNSSDYTDRVAGFVQEAANLQANLSVQEGEAASLPVSHIDGEQQTMEPKLASSKSNYVWRFYSFIFTLCPQPSDVLDMLDVIMEGSDGEMEEFGPSLSEDLIIQTFPFSGVVPAALEARNKLPADKGKW